MRNKKKPEVRVVTNDEPLPIEILESSILDISKGMKAINKSRLKRDAIVLLISDVTRLSKSRVSIVLNALDQLEDLYLKPKKQ